MRTNSSARELVTEILDIALWWDALRVIVQFLASKQVEQVCLEYGFVLNRDLAGKQQVQNQVAQLSDLESVVKKGLDEGTIEWAKLSDFQFHSLGAEMAFVLCNERDVHLASANYSLLLELGHKISASGIKVYDSGRLI